MEKIEVELKNLKKILVDDEYFYQVPDYQRPYSWDSENISELIDDLFLAFTTNKDKEYFCGSLVLVHNNRYDIIDGQQRITTFTIIACVIRELFFSDLTPKSQDYISLSIQDKYDSEKHKLRFLTNEHSQVDFSETVIKGIDFREKANIFKDFKNNRYLQNAYYLRANILNKLEEIDIDINEFVIWVYEKIVLTVIVTKDLDNAIQIFNVLNDRGMPLSPIDILKSSLMSKLSQEDRISFKAKWEDINRSLSLTDLFDFEDLLNTYLYYKVGSNPSTRYDKALLDIYKKDNIDSNSAIFEIGEFSKAYLEVINSNDKNIHLLKYLRHRIYWHSILSAAVFTKYEYLEELQKMLVAFYYQNWIAGATIARIKQTSFNILKAVKKGSPIADIKILCKENLCNYNTTETFKLELSSNYIYGRRWDRAILLLIEYNMNEANTCNYIHMNNFIQIEHILPQTPALDSEWVHLFSNEELEELTNSLGNLTLLSMRKNIQAFNYSFESKKDAYENKDDVITSFVITQKVLKNDTWTPQIIRNRTATMYDYLLKKIDIF